MNDNNKKAFKLAKIYMGTSDDLLFWVLIDTLFLAVVKDISTEQISLLFTISFWIALVFKYPCYLIVRKLDIASSVVVGSVLYLCSAIFLTFGSSFPMLVAGQCLYVIAPSFVSMGDVMMKELSGSSGAKGSFVEAKSTSYLMCASINLLAALLVTPLMQLNQYLPMFLCVLVRIASLFLSIRIKTLRPWEQEKNEKLVKEPEKTIQRSKVSFLVMCVAIGVFLASSIPNVKLVFQNMLSLDLPEERVIQLFSYVIIGTRIAKIIGSFFAKLMGRLSKDYARDMIYVLLAALLVPGICIISCLSKGRTAILLAGSGLIINYLLFDVLSIFRKQFLLDRLNQRQKISILFVEDIANTISTAIVSTIVTLIIANATMLHVMLLLVIIIFVALAACIRGYYWKKEKQNRYEEQWNKKVLEETDSKMTAVLILLSQYGFVESLAVDPAALAEIIHDVEHIDRYSSGIHFAGTVEYSYRELYNRYSDGWPCAIYADDGSGFKWYPVLYVDEDDAVIYNCYGDARFVSQFDKITEICCFTVFRTSLLKRILYKKHK